MLFKKLLVQLGNQTDIFWKFYSPADTLWSPKTVGRVLGYITGLVLGNFLINISSTALALPALIVLVLLFFLQFPAIISTVFFFHHFSGGVMKWGSIFSVINHKRWVCCWLNEFKLVCSTATTQHWWSWSTMQSTFICTQLFNFLQPFHIASINHS